ncbi:MAG: flagellar filament capping protein FliD [Verrucomicrobiales bacterium]|nr:flagellar filament capping protein FliD [Verrucomicrobiales bacterium]
MAGIELGLSGLASGFDWRSMVDQLTEVDRAPQRLLQTEQALIARRNSAYSVIQSQLTTLQSKVSALKDGSLFDTRAANSTDTDIASATASSASAVGSYKFKINSLATSSVVAGSENSGGSLSATDDVSSLVLSSTPFTTPVTAGTFTVNGKKVEVATTDTLQQVFDKISAATGGTVTGSYNSTDDKISLEMASGQKIILGSANDTSNFLTIARLNNNDTNEITSSSKLGALQTSSALSNSNFSTAITGGSAGAFKINGVSISYSTTDDTLNDVLDRISSSEAGVIATYDPTKDRVVLSNKTTGSLGMALEDVTGNFLAAAGLSTSTGLTLGSDLLYQLNDSTEVLSSKSNVIDENSSGIAGLNVSVLTTGTTTIDITTDTKKIKQAIKDFITEYNKSNSAIDSYTSSTTDDKGKVTAGILAAEQDAFTITSNLRSLSNSQITGLTGTIDLLSDLGISSNGTDNLISLSDEALLDQALASNLSGVKDYFTNSTSGMATKMHAYLERIAGEDGDLADKQATFDDQVSDIDTQIAEQERQVLAVRAAMIERFVAMETAQSKINQQLQYITKSFG